MDKLDFLDGGTPAEAQTAAPAPEAPPAPNAEPAQGPERGPDGKFLAKAKEDALTPAPAAVSPAPAPEPAPQSAEPPAQSQERAAPEGFVPLGVVNELREQIRQLKQPQEPQPQPQPQQQQQPPPDPYEDPEGYQAYVAHQGRVAEANWSRRLAEATHGAETVQQAHAWAFERAQNDPVFAAQSYNHPDPYGFAVDQWKRDQAINLLSDPNNFAKFQAFINGQAPSPSPAPAQPAPAPIPQSPTPPRSLAASPNAGGAKPGAIPTGPGAAFDAVFKD